MREIVVLPHDRDAKHEGVNRASPCWGKDVSLSPFYFIYLFMYLGRVCLRMQQKIIQAILFGSVFQINVNDSLWPWSRDQAVGDLQTGKWWLMAGLSRGGTGQGREELEGQQYSQSSDYQALQP